MYAVSVSREFKAQHYLIGRDWGEESKVHSHDYRLELRLYGNGLNEHGFLVDINEIEEKLDRVMENYQEVVLNELEDFANLNPTLEHFSRILCISLAKKLPKRRINAIELRLWESETAWASYRMEA